MTAPKSRSPGFFYGVGLPFAAASMLFKHPRVLVLAILPFALAIGFAVYVGVAIHDPLRTHATALLESVGVPVDGFLGGMVSLLLGVALFLASAFLMPVLSSLAAVPFNDFLAEAVETRADPPLPAAPPPTLSERVTLILVDLGKSVLALAVTIPTLIAALFPGAQIVAIPLLALVLTFQNLAYPQTRRREGVGDAFGFIGRNFGASLGFGLMCTFLAMVPFVALLVPTLAVIGGTLLYARAASVGTARSR